LGALQKLAKPIIYLALMSLCIYLAQAMQTATFGMLAVAVLFLGAWLFYAFAFGLDFRACLVFSTFFFVKPFIPTFYVVLVLLAFSLLTQYYQERRKLLWPYPLATVTLVATAFYGLIRSRAPGSALPYFFSTAIVPTLLFICFANSKIDAKLFDLWVRLIVYINVFLAFIGVIVALLNPTKRLGSLWITAMTINGFYLMGLFFAIALGIREKDKNKSLLWYLGAVIIFLGMVYTYTRMALLAVFFGFFLMMLKMKRFRLIGIIILLLIPLLIPASMLERVQSTFSFDMSIFIRLFAWYHALRQISLHPFFGIGISTWETWYRGIVPFSFLYAEHPHNLFLRIFVEIGVFGFISYFWIIYRVLKDFRKSVVKRSQEPYYWVIYIGVLSLLFSCLTDIFIQQYSISLAFWTCLAFMYMLSRQQIADNEDT
jgi:O-antigen ligase